MSDVKMLDSLANLATQTGVSADNLSELIQARMFVYERGLGVA